MLFSVFPIAAEDEDGTSCGQSDEALPAFPPRLHHRDHLQLSGEGKTNHKVVGQSQEH